MMNKKVIVITGASGTGKTTISRYLKEKYNIPQVLTHTTRLPRDGEANCVDYYFETDETFEHNHYLERVEYSGHKYGSSEEGLQKSWDVADIVSIVVDTKGAIAYQEKYGDSAIIIFMKADLDAVAERLKLRGDEKARLEQRIKSQENQRDREVPKEFQRNYYEIVNKDIKKTKECVDRVIEEIKVK
ncbi:guanylate kinase [Lactobacillus salsicarnum]|uniref:Guanylate kinase n=2 Tax=Companilactobacillus mishanensis TaxID=2486008 RepID=A0ABW9P6I0_9LACO|nr:guanylate kinase [Companilactobacillus mishanensis]